MQTFLPIANFDLSAQCLDYSRLGKQRSECKQILANITGQPDRWFNHPAVQMWLGYEDALCHYAMSICIEWRRRGYQDDCYNHFEGFLDDPCSIDFEIPWWFGDERLHSSHRSKLKSKLPSHYNLFGWSEPPNLPYYWPI